jgi:hypothetical protein
MFFGRKVWATVASSNASGSFDCVAHDETVSHSAQDDKRKTNNDEKKNRQLQRKKQIPPLLHPSERRPLAGDPGCAAA